MNLGIAAILWFGGIQVNIGSMTQGEIIAYINYVNLILSALIVLANLVVTFTKAAASANRVNEILEIETSIVDRAAIAEKEAPTKTPIVEFKNVNFSYDGSAEFALKNISLELEHGQIVGIIGSTGSGKSTLINLIARFYDATEGLVYVNGVNVKAQKQKELRNKIGIVPQQSILFSGTIEHNLKWGNEAATGEDLVWATKIAQAYEFIDKKPERFQSIISQGGANLSGGQKQRLAIARALIKKPEILILDDSCSALDYATDAALRKQLKQSLSELTVIMVTQRVTTIRNADLIVVLDDGEIVGMGKNDYLLETCLVYQEIYNSQEEKKEVAHN